MAEIEPISRYIAPVSVSGPLPPAFKPRFTLKLTLAREKSL
jgi:hypothetical protein